MIKEIKNTKKPFKYLVSTNLRDIIVLVREKVGMEWKDKMKMRFRIVDEYPYVTSGEDGPQYKAKEIEVDGEVIHLYDLEEYSLEKMLDFVNSKYKGERLVEEFINSTLKDAKTIEFPDDEEDEEEKDEDIMDMS